MVQVKQPTRRHANFSKVKNPSERPVVQTVILGYDKPTNLISDVFTNHGQKAVLRRPKLVLVL